MKIICIAKNYLKHVRELNSDVPQKPVFFMKPDSAIISGNKPFYLPDFSNDVQHEVEVVVKINRLGKNIAERFAHRYYDEIGIGIDFTARDIQRECIQNGLPWEIAKGFDGSAVLGEFVSKSELTDLNNLSFSLQMNDKIVQDGSTSDMIFKIDYLISYISRYVTLKIGDLIFTGTPEGVSKVNIGDRLIASIEGKVLLDFDVK